MMLYGISLIYGFTGTTSIRRTVATPWHDSGVGIGLIFGIVFLTGGPCLQGLRRAVPHVDARCV